MDQKTPLAARMRPRNLDEIIGQQHIINKTSMLYRLVKADRLNSMILYGPPGTGKTSIAMAIAGEVSANFLQINATTAGKKDMESAVKNAKELYDKKSHRTILFIDEIHRFNKAQQDYLLPFVEDGTLTLIGATTENPYFEVNKAILSRSTVFELKPLTEDETIQLIMSAVNDTERGLGEQDIIIEQPALTFLAQSASGDARTALNALELAVLTTQPADNDTIIITLDIIQDCIQKHAVRYDKDGDMHYNVISAFIKSIRGSDPDGALYWLARMLEAGEDIRFIARRIMISASEDIGNADPLGICVAVSACSAIERIGMPEAKIILAQAVTYLACAPKSNASYTAIAMAEDIVSKTGALPVPPHLQDCHYKSASKLGRGDGYKYPHDYPNNYTIQQYLPNELVNLRFYNPTENGYEKNICGHMNNIILNAVTRPKGDE